MKLMKRLLILIIAIIMFIPGVVFAATANFSVSAPSQGVVGNQLTVTVTLSSSSSIGSYELSLDYDKSYLQLSTAPEGANGTHIVDANKKSGVKQLSLVYKFKVLKSGTTTIRTTSTDAYDWERNTLSCVDGSKKITLKTQAEIEASYSSDAYLKSITVGEYTLDPTFNKETYDYTVEVPNEVEKVTISASKNDSNASISGTGEKELKEGSNKFEIVCTAQKGNSLTYTVTVNRKELNPIPVTVNGKSYSLVRKSDELPEYKSFVASTINYNENEIPALINEGISYTLVGVKDEEGNVYTYIFDNGNIKDEYYEITTGDLTILPKSIDNAINNLVRREININGHTIIGYSFKDNSKQVIIKGVNVYNGNESYYLYDLDNKIFIAFNTDDLEELNKQNDKFKLIILILGVIIVLLILLVIIKKPSNKKNKKEELFDEEDNTKEEVEEIKEEKVEEVKEEIPEEVEEPVEEVTPEHTKLSRRARKKIKEEEMKRLKEQAELDEQKELEEEIKKQEEELKERKKKIKKLEEPKDLNRSKSVEDEVDDSLDDEELDDPLNDDDDFMEFWETMEIKTQKKKD